MCTRCLRTKKMSLSSAAWIRQNVLSLTNAQSGHRYPPSARRLCQPVPHQSNSSSERPITVTQMSLGPCECDWRQAINQSINSREFYHRTQNVSVHKEELINLSHPPSDPSLGIFKDSSTLRAKVFFPQFDLYLRREWSDFHENFITDVSLNKEVPLHFASNPDLESRSGVCIRIQTADTDHILLGERMRSPTALVMTATVSYPWIKVDDDHDDHDADADN